MTKNVIIIEENFAKEIVVRIIDRQKPLKNPLVAAANNFSECLAPN